MIRDLSARRLAEFAFVQGDLYPPQRGRPVDAEEGIRVQQLVQQRRAAASPDYRKEVAISIEIALVGQSKALAGRVDGVAPAEDRVTIEEYKCCRVLPDEPDPVDLGQVTIYAGLWAATHADREVHAHLVYVEPEGLAEKTFAREYTRDQARAALAFVLLCYEVRLERHYQRVAARLSWSAKVAFPYDAYRPGQRAIARRAYVALKNRQNLLLEAPTGSGKTMAMLYPALRAQSGDEQIFFLTSRGSGALAALDAVRDLEPDTQRLSTVELTAKEKICFVEGMPCDASRCPYAAGYFDRVGPAVDDVLARGTADRSVVEQVARAHTVCPFELSLDAASWADLVIGDYNYVFDPVVRLQRFSGHADLHLLIDEAHNLSPRAQDMLGVAITRSTVRAAKKAASGELRKRIESIDRALLALRREAGEGEHELASVAALERALKRLMDTWAELEQAALEDVADEVLTLIFDASRWLRSSQWVGPQTFARIAHVSGRDITVRCVCLDPAEYTSRLMGEHAGVVRFSGTVSPLPLYQRLHGTTEEAHERGASPFDAAQVAVLVVRDIPTYYRAREASLPRLANLIKQVTDANHGRYLIALPSYEYLNQLTRLLETHDALNILAQTPRQTQEERDAMLQAFRASEHAVFAVVMGGTFSESVDFGDAPLAGVILVGIGLPPPTLARNLTAAHFDRAEGSGWGALAAYTQPAMTKIVQAAGRLIRSPDDRGVICLVDPRFTNPELQQFFPGFWRPQVVPSHAIDEVLRDFWRRPTIEGKAISTIHEHSTH